MALLRFFLVLLMRFKDHQNDILFPKAVPLIRAIELLESHFEKGFGVLTAVQVSLLIMVEMLTVAAILLLGAVLVWALW